MILLQGWGATADLNFFTLYPMLRGYRVVALDHRRHGRGLHPALAFSIDDCADDAAALLVALGIDRALAVGYAMGGAVALSLARRHPEQVSGIVLAATALELSTEPGDRALRPGCGLIESALRYGRSDSALQQLLRGAVDKQPSLDTYRSWLAGELRSGDIAGIVDAGRALRGFDARPYAGSIDQPVAVVVTTADRLVPARKQRALAVALGATMFEISGDHDAAITDSDEFGTSVQAALDHVRYQA